MNRYLAPLLLAVFVTLPACGDDTPERLIASAKEYLAKNDNKAAIIQLKGALQKNADSPEARFLLGKTLLDSGDVVSADLELRKAHALKHPDAAVLPALARTQLALGQAQQVVAQYASVALADPAAVADLKTSLASAHMRLGQTNEAEAALAAALQAVPEYAPALLARARLRAQAQDFEGAFGLIEKILAKNPGDYEALQFKGDLLYHVKSDIPGALAAQRKALQNRKDMLAAHASILSIHLAQKDLAAAKAQIDELKVVAPNHALTRYFMAELAFLGKDYKAAREHLQHLLRVAPDDIRSLQLAGAVELQSGALLQADKFLTKAMTLAPGVSATRLLLAQSLVRGNQPQRALEVLSPLLEAKDPAGEALSLAAQAHMQMGNKQKADAFFARMAKLNPNDALSRTAQAMAAFAKGDAESGFAQLEELAASDKGTVADIALITAHVRQRKFDAALKAIDGLEQKKPKDPAGPGIRGWVQMMRKDLPAARASFERALQIDPLYFPATASLAGMDLADKKPDQAKARFEAVLKLDRKNVRALLALAELRASSGGTKDEVAELLTEAVRLNPNEVMPRLLLVEMRLKDKDFKSALSSAQEAVAARADSAELLDALGRAQMASGNANQAVTTFSKLAELRPKLPLPQLRLAEAHAALKNADAVRQSYRRALAIVPGLSAAQRGLITFELAGGRYKEALTLAQAMQKSPGNEAMGSLYVGDIEATRKNWVGAASAYRTGLKKAPKSTELAMKLHEALMSGSQRAEATKFEATWLAERPKDLVFRYFLGESAMARSDYAMAEVNYLALLSQQPDHVPALNNLAWVTSKLKKPGALAYAEKANKLRPDQPDLMDTLAMILGESKQLAKAIEIETKVVALRPEHHPYRLNLARLYVDAGNKVQARAELDQLAKLGSKFAGQAEVTELLKALQDS